MCTWLKSLFFGSSTHQVAFSPPNETQYFIYCDLVTFKGTKEKGRILFVYIINFEYITSYECEGYILLYCIVWWLIPRINDRKESVVALFLSLYSKISSRPCRMSYSTVHKPFGYITKLIVAASSFRLSTNDIDKALKSTPHWHCIYTATFPA